MRDNVAVIDDTLGVVLAGGRSRRFGSDKAKAAWADETLLERAVRTLGRMFSDIVIAGPDAADGVRSIGDPVPDSGPLAGLVAGFDAAGGRHVFVLAVDLPLVNPDTVQRVAGSGIRPYQVRIARAGQRVQPLCGIYGADVAAIARRNLHRGDRSVKGVLRGVRVLSMVDVEDYILTNVNRPDDLATAKRVDDGLNTH